jgi:hypothetical protein
MLKELPKVQPRSQGFSLFALGTRLAQSLDPLLKFLFLQTVITFKQIGYQEIK